LERQKKDSIGVILSSTDYIKHMVLFQFISFSDVLLDSLYNSIQVGSLT